MQQRTGKCLCGAVSFVAEVETEINTCHCSMCLRWAGGPLLFVTAPGPFHGHTVVAYGALDDSSGMELGVEWFFDNKPQGYAFAGERKRVTEAEAHAMLEG